MRTFKPSLRVLLPQVLLVAAVAGGIWWLVGNTFVNLAHRGITVGFDFLDYAARFPISESLIPYSPTDSFLKAYGVGLGNTLLISILVSVAATGLGLLLAIMRLDANPVTQAAATGYVEAFRNTPVVVQLLFWYALITIGLPSIEHPLHPLPGVYMTDRGLYLPSLSWHGIDWPRLGHYNYEGGLSLSPEFAAVFAGLSLYSAAFICEIIRGGIQAVSSGQSEAAATLGLSPAQTRNLVLIPQALRVILPPMTNQYVNIVKNSTLCLVVGYPDLAFVTATTINQTGQALEGIVILMLVFGTISLFTSGLMALYNRRVALVER